MQDSQSLKRLIGVLNQGKKAPALKLVRQNPETAAIVSKMIRPRDERGFRIDKEQSHYSLNQGQLQAISDSIKNRTTDNENIRQLFPDIELATQILISSILSPKDMVKTELIYKGKEPVFPAELLMKLNDVFSQHFENHYNIKNQLQEILRDTLFDTGSYIKLVMPESTLDEIINRNKTVSTESLSELFNQKGHITTLGILGPPGKRNHQATGLEAFHSTRIIEGYSTKVTFRQENEKSITLENLEVTDNFKVLRLPKLLEVHNKQKIKSLIKNRGFDVSVESSKMTDAQLSTLLYKAGSTEAKFFAAVPTKHNSKRKSVGRPMVLKLPSESVIPVYVPGDESNHIGYFVLIDIDGNPVTRFSNQNYMDGLNGLLSGGCNNQSNSLSSLLINKAKKNLTANSEVPTLDQVTSVYSSIIETDLIQRLNNGIYKTNVAISKNQEIYRIMLARSLAAQYTRLVYVPKELITYFAFSYFPNGVGKSYLDNIKNLSSLRAILLFSKVMATVKSAISLTHVNMTLDPEDPDPMKTIETAQHEVAKMRQQYFPLGSISPVDLTDWIQRAGLEFSFEGHPGIPQTKFDFESKNIQHQIPDSDLDELLRKQSYMAFGLSPETIDNGFNSEFATTVVSNNILLSKRVIQLQNTFCTHLTEYAKKIIENDEILREELKSIMEENKALVEKNLTEEEKQEYTENETMFLYDAIERFAENLEISLPAPDITSLQNQATALDEYIEALDKVIESWISSNIVPSEIYGNINSNIDQVKDIVRSYYIRRWMSDNGYMPELSDLVTADEDGKATINIMDINKTHINALIQSCLNFIKDSAAIKTASDTDLENLGTPEGSTNSSSGSDSGSDSGSSGGDDFGGDDFGGGDFGGDDFGGDDTGDTTPEESTSDNTPPEDTSAEDKNTPE